MKRLMIAGALSLLPYLAWSGQLSGGILFPGPGVGSATAQPPGGASFWLSADCITYTSGVCSVPATGTSLTTWSDRSGNANDATKVSGTCTFTTSQINSKPAVTFGPCRLGLASNVGPGGGTWTVFVVAKRSDTTTKGAFVSSTSGAALKYWTGGGSAEQGIDTNDTGNIAIGTKAVDTAWHQMNMLLKNASVGGTYALRLDRAVDGSGSNATNITVSSNTIGSDPFAGNNNFLGQIAELIFYNSALTTTQITQVETYLNTKYAL